MRILHVLPSLSPKLGGPTQAALNFVYHLRQGGVDAEIATTNDDEWDLLDVPLYTRMEYQGVPVCFFPRLARLKAFMPSPALTRWLWQHLKDYDLLHTHYLFCYPSTSAMMLARWQKVPYIARTIGQLTPWALDQGQAKKKLYSTLLERHNLSCSAAVHCTTVAEADNVSQFGVMTRNLVLPLGVNPPLVISHASVKLRERYSLPATSTVLLFLSRLHEKKRPDFLLKAFAQLNPKTSNYYLFLAGSGNSQYCDRLNALAHTLGVAENVIFTGFVEGSDKDLLLQGSDLFALPSYSENFGIAVAEALIAELPVIITPDVQISPDIVAAGAGWVVSDDLDAWAEALSQLLRDSELRCRLAANGNRLAQSKYNWPIIAQQLTQSYQEILADKPLSFAYNGNQAQQNLKSIP